MFSQKLHRFISNGTSMDFGPSIPDCCMWPANWCVECGNEDPGARWRDSYTETEAVELIERYGLLELWTLGMIEAGIPEADEPQIGDVGIVELETNDGINQCGAIFTGKRWNALSPKGVFQARMKPIKVWRTRLPIREACRG